MNKMMVGGLASLCVLACAAETTYTVPAGETEVLSGAVSGAEGVTKDGDGTLRLDANWDDFTGELLLAGGVLSQNVNGSLLNANAKLTIQPGATFDLGGAADATENKVIGDNIANRFTVDVAGRGFNGAGAIDNTNVKTARQCGSFKYATASVNLLGDTLFRATRRWGLAENAVLNLNGYDLEKDGTDIFGINGGIVRYQGGETVTVSAGTWNTEMGTRYEKTGEGDDLRFVFKNGAKAQFQSASVPFTLPLEMQNGSTLYFHNSAKQQGQINGPVNLVSGTVKVDANLNNAFRYGTINGTITGDGLLAKQGDGVVTVTGTANDWTGGTTAGAGVLVFSNEGALPLAGTIQQTGNGVLGVDLNGWTGTGLSALLNYENLNGIVSLYNDDTAKAVTFAEDVASDRAGLGKAGAGKVVTTGDVTLTSKSITVSDGEWAIEGGTVSLPGTTEAYVGNLGAGYLGVLSVKNATLTVPVPEKNGVGSKEFRIGQNDRSRGVLVVDEGATVSTRFNIAQSGTGHGAIIQNGGYLRLAGGRGNDGYLGNSGFCYVELNDGLFDATGMMTLGQNGSARAVMIQNGGTVTNSVAYEGGLMVSRGGRGHYYQCGGEYKAVKHDTEMLRGTGTNAAVGIYTVDGEGYTELNRFTLGTQSRTDSAYTALVNLLDSGTLALNNFRCRDGNDAAVNAKAYINFNGGVLKARRDGAVFDTAEGHTPNAVVAYERGAIIDTNGKTVDFNQPLIAPTGMGILSITPNEAVEDSIGSPYVEIEGGDGVGASAVALFDSEYGDVTGIKITSPGMGFTSAPTVTLKGGRTTGNVTATATIGPNVSGGLVKRGAGTLKLTCANTFAGGVVVEEGTLDLAHAAAYPAGCDLKIADGTLTGSVQGTIAVGTLASVGGNVNVGLSVQRVTADLLNEGYTVLAKSPAAIPAFDLANLASYAGKRKILLASYEPLPTPKEVTGFDGADYGWRVVSQPGLFVDPATGLTANGYVLKVAQNQGTLLIVR